MVLSTSPYTGEAFGVMYVLRTSDVIRFAHNDVCAGAQVMLFASLIVMFCFATTPPPRTDGAQHLPLHRGGGLYFAMLP